VNAVANNSDCQPFGMGEMCIELTEEGGFEVVESDPGDSAFETSAPVVCVECGRSIPFVNGTSQAVVPSKAIHNEYEEE